ncbi:MAG TPA: efflux RND transporter permease subunit, partial [Burkholderiaceae bacterium]|nr:efflux RND transporter permease subunit [Burkholderiaceae bacterium]
MSVRPGDAPPAGTSAADATPGGFNVSAAAIRHPQLTLFFLLVVAIAGTLAFFKLGQREDPDFAFRGMVIRTLWPGATTEQVDRQVTDRIEKKLQETPYFKGTRSYSKPGESLIVLELLDTAPRREVPQIWYQVRKKVGDIRATLPAEAIGPFFNDEFGDVFGTIYAFTGDGFSLAELRDAVEAVRQELLRLPDVAKVELVGQQDEKVFVELSPQLLANLGIDPQRIAEQLAAQNVVAPAGTIQGESRQVPLRVTGQFDTVREVEELRLNIGGRTVRLGDGAKVWRGYGDPPAWTMRFGGRQAVGLAVSMVPTGDVLELGENLEGAMARLGGSAVSVSWRSTAAELRYLLGHSGAKAVFFEHDLAATVEE